MRTLLEALIGGLIGAAFVLAAIAVLLRVQQADDPVSGPALRLGEVKSWSYQLQNLDKDLGMLADAPTDMLVVDYAKSGQPRMQEITGAEVARLKQGPDGRRRIVLAYFSVGEAEEYRFYWQAGWKTSPPDWLISENCRWPRNHLVRFWEPGWRDIVFSSTDSYLARIMGAGFDGVYLDRVDVYWDLKDKFPDAEGKMIDFVKALARQARSVRPDFLINVQNAEGLLSDAGYRASIDAIAKEDLLHGVNGSGVRNSTELINWSIGQIEKLQKDGKPAFAVEYLTAAEQIAKSKDELAQRRIVTVFPPRLLDGSDPLARSIGPATYGSPEYAATKCNGVWKKPS